MKCNKVFHRCKSLEEISFSTHTGLTGSTLEPTSLIFNLFVDFYASVADLAGVFSEVGL